MGTWSEPQYIRIRGIRKIFCVVYNWLCVSCTDRRCSYCQCLTDGVSHQMGLYVYILSYLRQANGVGKACGRWKVGDKDMKICMSLLITFSSSNIRLVPHLPVEHSNFINLAPEIEPPKHIQWRNPSPTAELPSWKARRWARPRLYGRFGVRGTEDVVNTIRF
jgi:hypothetical protein